MGPPQSTRRAPVKRRLHPLGAFSAVLDAARRFLFVMILAFWRGSPGDGGGVWLEATTVTLVVAYGLGRWWRMRYWFDGTALRVSDGFLLHREIFLERDKVQAVDVRADLVQRLFNVVRVQIKTGATGTQVDLSAVTREEADRIRALLDPEGAQARPSPTPAEPTVGGRWRITGPELALLGATSGRLGVFAAALGGIYGQVHEPVTDAITAAIERIAQDAPTVPDALGPLVVGVVLAAIVGLTWTLSIVGAALAWGDFSVGRKRDRVVVARGLLERREVSVQRDRIQAITVVEELLQQPLGRCAVYVESIGHAEEKGASTCLHPFLRLADLPAFLHEITPGFYAAPVLDRPPQRALVRALLRPTRLVVIGVGIASVWAGWFALLGLAVLPPMLVLAGVRWRDTGAGVVGPVLVVRSRGTSRRTAFLPRRGVQTIAATATWFQRRRRLGDLAVVAASGATGRTYVAPDLGAAVPAEILTWARRGSPAHGA